MSLSLLRSHYVYTLHLTNSGEVTFNFIQLGHGADVLPRKEHCIPRFKLSFVRAMVRRSLQASVEGTLGGFFPSFKRTSGLFYNRALWGGGMVNQKFGLVQRASEESTKIIKSRFPCKKSHSQVIPCVSIH